MSSSKTPNFVTIKEYTFLKSYFNEKVLPAGTFVRPISLKYLPDHIKNTADYLWFSDTKEMFVYCSMGIVCIPKDIVRQL